MGVRGVKKAAIAKSALIMMTSYDHIAPLFLLQCACQSAPPPSTGRASNLEPALGGRLRAARLRRPISSHAPAATGD